VAADIVVPEKRMRGPAIALVAAALAGCASLPNVVGLERDPGFTYEALTAAPLAVLGVTVKDLDPMSASASLQLGGLLAESLTRKRRDLRILPAAHVADSLGLRDYTGLVREYQARGWLDSRALSRLAAALGGVRYLLLARLEADELVTGNSVEEYTEEHEGQDCMVEQTTNFAARTLVVHFTIYDLHQRRSAWTGQITDLEERTSRDDWNSCDPLLFSVLSMLFSGGDPDPPELAEVLRKVFEDFALHLPRA
jgi:hypothetical protein